MPIDANRKLIYPELSYSIYGILYKVHNLLGRYCREKQYSDAVENLLKEHEINYLRESPIEINLGTTIVPSGNKIDFLIEDKIILECKAKDFITKQDYFQIKKYLIASQKKLGILVNFRQKFLKPRRVINSKIRI